MKLKLSELNPNPFKKHINAGKLNKNRIAILKESIDHGTLPEHFYARKNNGIYELTSGHHTIAALKEVKGFSYEVDVTIVDFTDEQMLIDMVRENITQRDTDFHDTREGIVLARNWLESESTGVKQFNNGWNQQRDNKGQFTSDVKPTSNRSIANFLSKNGKVVSYVTVKNYLDISDNLDPELLENVKKQDHAAGEKKDDSLGVKDAIRLSHFPKDEQKKLAVAIKNSREQHGNLKQKNLTAYKNAPDEIKQKVRQGELDLADIEFESEKQELIEEAEKRPTTIFIPNFSGRLREFRKDVRHLEKQVQAFSTVFHSQQFKERYHSLKPKDKKNLNEFIFNVRERIKDCYDEVDFFIKQLPENVILLEVKP